MPSRLYSFFVYIGIFVIIAGTVLFIAYKVNTAPAPVSGATAPPTETASVQAAFTSATTTASIVAATSSSSSSTSSNTKTTSTLPATNVTSTVKGIVGKSTRPTATSTLPTPPPQSTASGAGAAQAERIQNPYSFPPETFTKVNTDTRAALVNILCMPRGGGSISPISGSGVIIDPRGVILTNSHVAQYILLSEDADINLSCEIRTGAPASAQWSANVLYMPPVWVKAHASEINTAHPTGTGEHDYALLLITAALPGQNLPATFPYLPYDTREAIGFLGDQVLGASYPAEFLGGITTENDLSPVSSVSPLDQLLTFASSTVDVISLGGVVEAQSGSSGGAVVNQWGYLIGIIATTSDAPTTAGRDLRAITMSYITRDIQLQTGLGLTEFLSGDLAAKETDFNTNIAPDLLRQYIKLLSQ